MHIRACTRRPIVGRPVARRRPAGRGRPRWVHSGTGAAADRRGDLGLADPAAEDFRDHSWRGPIR
ncbi:hypothetical protein [Geodermatophilus sp. URMC 64]